MPVRPARRNLESGTRLFREAEKNGKEAEVKRLKETWSQERFARAFEEYLHSGDAPTSTLKQIFRRFKRWLTQIYRDVTGAGVRATPKVEAVMARMVATDAEIEAAAMLKRADRIAEVDPGLLHADTAEMVLGLGVLCPRVIFLSRLCGGERVRAFIVEWILLFVNFCKIFFVSDSSLQIAVEIVPSC